MIKIFSDRQKVIKILMEKFVAMLASYNLLFPDVNLLLTSTFYCLSSGKEKRKLEKIFRNSLNLSLILPTVSTVPFAGCFF